MMKLTLKFLLAAVCILLLFSCNDKAAEKSDKLMIYTYGSFFSEWGPGPDLLRLFKDKYGIDADFESPGDSVTVLQKAIMEKKSPKADIFIGVDNNLLSFVMKEDLFMSYRPENINKVPDNLIVDKSFKMIPYDYGHFAICYDSESVKKVPESLQDLTSPEYKNKLVLIDPRTSSPGMGFLLWTVAEFGDNYLNYWKQLKPSVLTYADSWSKAYGLFTSGEAPMVLSYTTSPVYHAEYENNYRYKAIAFENGNYVQIEFLGIIKGARHKNEARKFIDFILTEEAQKIIATKNIMFPVVSGVSLPESFSAAAKPEKNVMLDSGYVLENKDKWINGWLEESIRK